MFDELTIRGIYISKGGGVMFYCRNNRTIITFLWSNGQNIRSWEIQSAMFVCVCVCVCARERCYTSFSGRAAVVILAQADTVAIVTRLCFPRDIVLSLRQDVTRFRFPWYI